MMSSVNSSVEELQKKEDSSHNRRQIVNLMMKKPQKDSLNYHYTLVYLVFEILV